MDEDYVHRIGRTARNGASGEAVSFVTPEEHRTWQSLVRKYKITGADLKWLSAAERKSHLVEKEFGPKREFGAKKEFGSKKPLVKKKTSALRKNLVQGMSLVLKKSSDLELWRQWSKRQT